MKSLVVICCFLTFSLAVFGQEDIAGNLMHDGNDRTYNLHLPPNYETGNDFALVLNFHGYSSNALQQQFYSGMNVVADAEGFIVCYPEGIDNQWNAGFSLNTDDVGFTHVLLDELLANYKIDANRIYSTGMSNGGYFSYKLACEMTDRIAAIASVTGSMVPAEMANCNPSRQIPVMQIHGTADPTVAYNGSSFSAPIEDVMQFWAAHNSCDGNYTEQAIEDINMEDGCTSEIWTYTNCNPSKEVVLYRVIAGGHTWPGASLPIGVTSQDFNGSQVVWDFFKQYSLDSFVNVTDIENQALKILPNPASEFIEINGLQETTMVSVYDLKGSLIKELEALPKQKIALDFLQAGVYLLQANGETVKFIKK